MFCRLHLCCVFLHLAVGKETSFESHQKVELDDWEYVVDSDSESLDDSNGGQGVNKASKTIQHCLEVAIGNGGGDCLAS